MKGIDKTLPQGASGTLYAALDPSLEGEFGPVHFNQPPC
jgi:hypothetical protein